MLNAKNQGLVWIRPKGEKSQPKRFILYKWIGMKNYLFNYANNMFVNTINSQ